MALLGMPSAEKRPSNPAVPSFGFARGDAEIEALVRYLRALPARSPGL